MHANGTQPQPRTTTRIVPVKFVIAGGFGVGKTTFVGAISEIEPLRTEAAMTSVSSGIDDTTHVGEKTTTTVAMDFGRITVDDTLVMYLFGTPGQDRFGFMWDDICNGALGAVVLVDTRRVDQCFPAIDYFEAKQVPFVIGVNAFQGAPPVRARRGARRARRGRSRARSRLRRPPEGEREARAHHPSREPGHPGEGSRGRGVAPPDYPRALLGRVAQLARASALHAECRGFESLRAHDCCRNHNTSAVSSLVTGRV